MADHPGDPSGLIASLQRQPLLAVLRPHSASEAHRQLQQLQAVGLLHVELAVPTQPEAAWIALVRELAERFPGLRLGAASVRTLAQLEATRAAGLAYGVSPILDPPLIEAALHWRLTLVPGVFTPTEVHGAQGLGCALVKLYPAATLGPSYWSSLRGPLGPLPACIAAGGLHCGDVLPWLAAGVAGVALGSSLFVDRPRLADGDGTRPGDDPPAVADADLDPDLAELLARLQPRGEV